MPEVNLIDVEASGLDNDSYPIEIAIWIGGAMHSWLIQPEPEWTHWDEVAEGLHGISREQLRREGKPVHLVADELNRLCAGATLYSDAPAWDGEWVRTLFRATLVAQELSIEDICERLPGQSWVRFMRKLEEFKQDATRTRHRAAADVQMMLEAYRYATEAAD